jgi:hypothetical protein
LDALVAAMLPGTSARVVQVVEYAIGESVPSDPVPPGVKLKNLTGGQRVDVGLADPQDVVAAVRSAITREPTPPEAEQPQGERQHLVELAPGSRALQLDCCAYGGRFARREQRPRLALTLSDDELMGRG